VDISSCMLRQHHWLGKEDNIFTILLAKNYNDTFEIVKVIYKHSCPLFPDMVCVYIGPPHSYTVYQNNAPSFTEYLHIKLINFNKEQISII